MESSEVKKAGEKPALTKPLAKASLDILQKIDKMIQEPGKVQTSEPRSPTVLDVGPVDNKVRLFKEIFKGEILP